MLKYNPRVSLLILMGGIALVAMQCRTADPDRLYGNADLEQIYGTFREGAILPDQGTNDDSYGVSVMGGNSSESPSFIYTRTVRYTADGHPIMRIIRRIELTDIGPREIYGAAPVCVTGEQADYGMYGVFPSEGDLVQPRRAFRFNLNDATVRELSAAELSNTRCCMNRLEGCAGLDY